MTLVNVRLCCLLPWSMMYIAEGQGGLGVSSLLLSTLHSFVVVVVVVVWFGLVVVVSYLIAA